MPLPPTSHISYIQLRVPDLKESLTFYKDLLGFKEITREDNTTVLSTEANDSPLLLLEEHPQSPPRPPHTTGLYHIAYLFPSRKELARIFKRLYQYGWTFQGFADHGVSEALYLADPHGNGIELYADRPREQWTYTNGELALVTEPLDLDSLVAELQNDSEPWNGVAPKTRIGHIHLNISDLGNAEKFYCEILGFDVVVRTAFGALFVSAGGYHHHIGLNIWNGRSALPPPSNALGLARYGIAIPDEGTKLILKKALRDLSYDVKEAQNGFLVQDFDGIQINIH